MNRCPARLALPALLVACVLASACGAAPATTATREPTATGEPRAGFTRDHEGNLKTADGQYVHSNALVFERSPYLAQHAHNPVDWLPWGEEAFAKARAENKPIFLSIGYSTCHWCHVMARESFSDEEVAPALNQWFVPVKVDREERPDVDDVYMSAAHVLGRRGGWPLSAWLTPEREPFDVGTYFPREEFLGRLTAIALAWQEDPERIEARAAQIAQAVKARLGAREAAEKVSDDVLDGVVARMASGYDATWGGWGVPKFPRESTLLFLLDRWQHERDERALRMALAALEGMQGGGIHDQVGGGFHRYSVDARWLVPHFEKMLYNQAWLGRAFLEAWRLTGDERYRRTAEGVLEYVRRDLTGPGGGFFSAEDADSEGEEGTFYVWEPEEIREVLGEEEAALALEWLGVGEDGNFAEHPGASILTARAELPAFAADHGLDEAAFVARVEAWQAALVAARARRERPHLDDKVLVDWNGAMIGTFARAAATLDDPAALATAEEAAAFVLSELVDEDGRLLHAWRGEPLDVFAFLEDHAGLVDGLIELHDATGKRRWLDEAVRLHEISREQFRAESGGFARTGPRHEALIARSFEGRDGAVPSGNSLTAWNAVRLWRRTGDASFERDAEGIFRAFAQELARAPVAPFMLRAVQAWRRGEAGPVARTDESVARLEAPRRPTRLVPGEPATVPVELFLAEGWHVGAADPGAVVRATSVEVGSPHRASAVRMPDGEAVTLPFTEERARLYVGGETFEIDITTETTAAAVGPGIVLVDVALQACDDAKCLKPTTVRLELPVVVTAAPPEAR